MTVGELDDGPFWCLWCNTTFGSLDELMKHNVHDYVPRQYASDRFLTLVFILILVSAGLLAYWIGLLFS